MTTQNLPGADAARHGTGDADLTIMLAAHNAFRRDLTRLVRAAAAADLSDPARRRPVAAGLAASGDDGSVALSARGRALREEVLAASAKVTGPMLATIDRAELDATIRTLEKITRLARETSDTEGSQ